MRYSIRAIREDGTRWEVAGGESLDYVKSDLRGYYMCNQGRCGFALVDTKTDEDIMVYEAAEQPDLPSGKIKVVNKRDGEDGEYIGRPSVLGNPYTIGKDGNREEVILKYRLWLGQKVLVDYDAAVLNELHRLKRIFQHKGELTLVCWCAPKSCHGDIIAKAIQTLIDEENDDRGQEAVQQQKGRW